MPTRKNLMLREVRLNFPNLFETKQVGEGDSARDVYSAMFLLPKDHPQIDEIERAVNEIMAEDFPKVAKKNLKSPLRDGEDKQDDDGDIAAEYYRDSYFINASSTRQPQCVTRMVKLITDPDEMYSGCWVNATVTFYSFDKKGNRGVAAGLNNLQFVRDGDRLGGAKSATEEFKPISDAGGGQDDESDFG